ncbi:hypothetical protein V495_06994 [Pseudogymnoascus sp. VKM F-4514 (FW-929)]|nr:hypothetical protein V490_00793 [Pseudogymnoascus sp. VKM F-3557]KFY37735.1 hypothetical protein V495_06994 [Pseudogymnoascus sp. VKM F-4514 (FW-929)]KFY54194.1 hypothetical protein V497_07883 [Pseudogymnoascus sp. VKM F-4516 (FW-969)]
MLPKPPTYLSTPPLITPKSREGCSNYISPTFPLGPFVKYKGNPLLVPNPENDFESAYIYNAAAIVLDDIVYLLYRAQNAAKVSFIGLAWSGDGFNFTRLDHPVLEPTEAWEAGGGVEDPRITRVDGTFYMTYTAYDLHKPRLCLATSTDLVNWKKYPPMFTDWADIEIELDGSHSIRRDHSKAGAIFAEKNAAGKYMMVWGDSFLQLAESDDLINWNPLPFNQHFATGVHQWENRLLEPGPAPIKTRDGKWILVYNAATTGGSGFASNQYSISQMLVDYKNIRAGPLARLEWPSLLVEAENEHKGQVNEVVFCEGMVQFKGQWLLYYGQGDSELGVAVADAH